MPETGTTKLLRESLTSWDRSDRVLIWLWALCAPSAVTAYEIFLNDESQHPGSKFWTDLMPGYFEATLVFTAVTLGLSLGVSKLSPRFKGWLSVLAVSIALSMIPPFMGTGRIDWADQLQLARNFALLTTLYLIPPYLVASLMRSCGRPAIVIACMVVAANYFLLHKFGASVG